MLEQPCLETERLTLRPFTLEDAPEVKRLAGDWDIASTTIAIPHPYEDGMAEAWIGTHSEAFEKGELACFAVVLRGAGRLIGAVALEIDRDRRYADLGYWIAKPRWGRGYATEAARAVRDYGFEALGLDRIRACHFTRNPASGRVLEKVGMTFDLVIEGYVDKWGALEDVNVYSMTSGEYREMRERTRAGREQCRAESRGCESGQPEE